ncbi:nibrin isoform X2 [Cephus cinctus]|uniref:Nibrin isoform X2 n=1 Tax=Cephus cinctus TaxID=211228 RepID=A0AAJ7W5U5_CEPCN|nr:nibrin isoform X2 [Cephus cinctus]
MHQFLLNQFHKYRVHYIPIITATSGIDDDVKLELTDIMNSIDGVITPNNVLSSTHLTVSTGFLTEKVACALAACIPIVNVRYWRDVLSAVRGNKPLPDSSQYTQPLNEDMIQKEMKLLSVNPCRSKLFKNLLFVFLTSLQYNNLSRMIKAAGGKCLLYEKKPLHEKELSAANVIILQPPDDSSQTENSYDATYASIRIALLKTKRRMIPETDVSLAILYCSTENYCNPQFHFGNLLSPSKKQSSQANAKIIQVDSQDYFAVQQDLNVIPSSGIPNSSTKNSDYIPETNTSTNSSEIIPGTQVSSMTSKIASMNKMYEANQNINDIEISRKSQKGSEKNWQVNKFTKKNIPTSQAHSSRCNMIIPETEDQSGIMEDITALDDDNDKNNSNSKKNEASKNIESKKSGLLSLNTKQKRERCESSVDSIAGSKKQRIALDLEKTKLLQYFKKCPETPEKRTTLSPSRFSCNVETDQHLSNDNGSHNVTKAMKPNKATRVPSLEIKQVPNVNVDDDPLSVKVKTEDVNSKIININPERSLARIKLDRTSDGFYRRVQHYSSAVNFINKVPLLRKTPSSIKPKGLRMHRIPKKRILIKDMYICNLP